VWWVKVIPLFHSTVPFYCSFHLFQTTLQDMTFSHDAKNRSSVFSLILFLITVLIGLNCENVLSTSAVCVGMTRKIFAGALKDLNTFGEAEGIT